MSEKRFDTPNVKDRMVKRLAEKSDWKELYSNSVIDGLLDVTAYSIDELARYLEYLYTETKWDYARSFYGLKSQGKMIGAKRCLPQVAIGSLVVSHTDVKGNNRLKNFNSMFFDLNATSDYDSGKPENYKSSNIETYSLVPWQSSSTYTIQKNRQFKSTKNTSLVATSLVEKTIKDATSEGLDSTFAKDPQGFKDNGAWNGYKYLIVPVALGEVKSHTLTTSAKGTSNEAFFVPFINVDGGLSPLTSDFFTITQNYNGKITKFKFAMNLNLCDSSSECFSYEISNEEDGFYVYCGNNKNGKTFTEGATLTLNYIEANDVSCKKGEIDTVSFSNTDPRNGKGNFLSCYNTSVINNYRPMETLDEFKSRAPASYLTEYACLNEPKLIEIVKRISPVYLADVNVEISSKALNFYVLNKSYGQLDSAEKIDLKSSLVSYLSNLSYLKKEIDLGLLSIKDIYAEPFKIDYVIKSQYEGVDITDSAFEEVKKRILSKYHLSKKDVNGGKIETSDFGYYALSSAEISSAEPSPYIQHCPDLKPEDIGFLSKGNITYTGAYDQNYTFEDSLVVVRFKPVSEDVANNYENFTNLLNESSGFGHSSFKIDFEVDNMAISDKYDQKVNRSILFNKNKITDFEGIQTNTGRLVYFGDGENVTFSSGSISELVKDENISQKIFKYTSFWPFATTTTLFDSTYSSPIYQFECNAKGEKIEFEGATILEGTQSLYTRTNNAKVYYKNNVLFIEYLKAYVNEKLNDYCYLVLPLEIFKGTYKNIGQGIVESDDSIKYNSNNVTLLRNIISSRLKITCNIPIKRDLESSYSGYFYTQKNLIDYKLES